MVFAKQLAKVIGLLETLVFFDEIQECTRAITSLKYFCEKMRDLHVVCAGSLLGVALKKEQVSFPVGKVNRLQLYPMSFKEFIIANDRMDLIEVLNEWPTDREIPKIYKEPMEELEDALQWLVDAGLLIKTELVGKPEIPLEGGADKTYFKVYMSDVGLLRAKSKVSVNTILEESDLYIRYKGAFAENYVLNELKSLGKAPFFWRSGNTAEVDFIYEDEGDIVPVEVKAADNTQAKSYKQFCKKYNSKKGLKLSRKNIAENFCESTVTYNIPLYLEWNIDRYINLKATFETSKTVFDNIGI